MAVRSILKGDDYNTKFDSEWYLKAYHSSPLGDPEEGATTFLYEELHETYTSGKVRGQRLLEFGSGPTVHTLFSARNAFDEITCCEFAECNRRQIEKWWRKEDGAHDWSEIMKHVAHLEQHSDYERIAAEVRSKLQEVLPCDAHQKNPLHPSIREPYDAIMTSLTLEACCESIEQYNNAVANVSNLLQKGGHFIQYGVLNESFYVVKEERFFCLRLTQEDVQKALKLAGFENIKTKLEPLKSSGEASDFEALFYTTGTKR